MIARYLKVLRTLTIGSYITNFFLRIIGIGLCGDIIHCLNDISQMPMAIYVNM